MTRVTLNEQSDWREVASVRLPDSLTNLSDDELEYLRQDVEDRCIEAFLSLIDGD